MSRVFATADIGSNTVHLLIASVEERRNSGAGSGRSPTDNRQPQIVTRIENQSEWLALGEAVARTGEIPLDRAESLIQLLRDYEDSAQRFQAERLYVFATEAMRAALNSSQVLERIRVETGIVVDLISPRREAELSLKGVGMESTAPLGLLLEVGGGSAQIAICNDKLINAEYSLPIGTGRLQADLKLSQPATNQAVANIREIIVRSLQAVPKQPINGLTVASGGIARGLWRALHPDGEQNIALPEIEFLEWTCARLTRDQIGKRFGVKSKRAAAMLPGAIVYGSLMRHFRIEEIFVSEFGVREGAILEMAED